MSEDIVERMRFWSKTRNDNPTAWNLDCGAAADEIVALRDELQKACRRTETLTAQRDMARRTVCRVLVMTRPSGSKQDAHGFAKEMGWDCYEEDGQ